MLEKCALTILELNWNQRLGNKKTKLNICHQSHMPTSPTQLNENVFKMSKHESLRCTCKACKNTVFHCQICKFVGFLLPSSSWLLKLPIIRRPLRRRNRKRIGAVSLFVSIFKCFLRQYPIPLHLKEILLIIFASRFPRVHHLVEKTAFQF